jgi:hypothetical protein
MYFFTFIYLCFGAVDQTKGLAYAKQPLDHWATYLAPNAIYCRRDCSFPIVCLTFSQNYYYNDVWLNVWILFCSLVDKSIFMPVPYSYLFILVFATDS